MRRQVIGIALGAIFFGLSIRAEAQQTPKVPRIAFLAGGSRSVDSRLLETFWQRMKEIGYIEGKNIAVEYRFAEGCLSGFRTLRSSWCVST